MNVKKALLKSNLTPDPFLRSALRPPLEGAKRSAKTREDQPDISMGRGTVRSQLRVGFEVEFELPSPRLADRERRLCYILSVVRFDPSWV